MLVLTRLEGQRVVIGDPRNPIGVVTLVSVRGEQARIGFEFPTDIAIHREEVAIEILNEEEAKGKCP